MAFQNFFRRQSQISDLLGLEPGIWYIFYQGGILVSYFFIGYGVYLFYKSGQ